MVERSRRRRGMYDITKTRMLLTTSVVAAMAAVFAGGASAKFLIPADTSSASAVRVSRIGRYVVAQTPSRVKARFLIPADTSSASAAQESLPDWPLPPVATVRHGNRDGADPERTAPFRCSAPSSCHHAVRPSRLRHPCASVERFRSARRGDAARKRLALRDTSLSRSERELPCLPRAADRPPYRPSSLLRPSGGLPQ